MSIGEEGAMDLDRAAITGQAFSTAIDGYDRQEVDRHLAAIAQALEAAQLTPIGARAGEKLREILEGAERSAEALRQASAEEARSVSEAARQEAEVMRVKADEETATQLLQARLAVKGLLERVEALHLGIEHTEERVREAGEEMARRLAADAAPVERVLRERAEALGAELDLMGSGLSGGTMARVAEQRATLPQDGTGLSDQDLEAATGALEVVADDSDARARTAAIPDTDTSPSPILASDSELVALGRREIGDEQRRTENGTPPAPSPARAPAPPAANPNGAVEPNDAGEEDGDTPSPPAPRLRKATGPDEPPQPAAGPRPASRSGLERARLVALNMALAGASQDETERHLREKFAVDDPGSILREVYARADGLENGG